MFFLFSCFPWFSMVFHISSLSLKTNHASKFKDQLDSSGLTLDFVNRTKPLCPCSPFCRLKKKSKKKWCGGAPSSLQNGEHGVVGHWGDKVIDPFWDGSHETLWKWIGTRTYLARFHGCFMFSHIFLFPQNQPCPKIQGPAGQQWVDTGFCKQNKITLSMFPIL